MSHIRKDRRWQPVCGVLALSLMMSACSSVSEFSDSINPFSKEKVLQGDRQPVFDGADPAAVAQARTAKIGGASGGQSWPTAGGSVTNDPGNVAANISGGRIWRANIGASGGSFTSDALRTSARPVSDGSRIYVYKPNGDVIALSTGGARVWTRSLRPEGEKDVAPGGGVTVSGNRVYVSTGYSQVVALDASSGQVIWTGALGTPARGAPVASNGLVFTVTDSNEVYALNESDGTEAWNYAGISESAGVLSAASPAVSGGRVIVPTSAGEVMALDVKKGEPVWIDAVARGFRTFAVSGLSDVSASPVVADGTVYATGVAGRTIATSLKTGQRVWDKDIGAVHTPVVSGSALFLVDLEDRMVALDRKTGDTLWSAQLPKPEKKKQRRNWAGPVLANGVLIAVSSDGRLAKVDATSGQIMSTSDVKTDVYVTPIIAGGRMIVLDGSDAVAAFN
ncbi:outer membrane protein assembly factor BamB family protein [Roseibium suaedae]|uniref:Outer membrane protein assembly factor BamB, contains PQQ-like beta-propeller repeat n=1 Tax=Roseibium suaedae TaxID=735517 RepID=A0A1M7LHM1_9HYPH|nr:PQQ-binding-like beta-propeller repeat protein [Roseibium suaedae]SHM77613.1 Outer membrane protein assembly factor BamB, contains PQQ-like beta-propeller repeat [Roseibium suaedae]